MASNMKFATSAAGSLSAGAWKLVEGHQERMRSSDTRGISSEGTLMVQGRIVQKGQGGGTQLVVTIDPTMVDRKLAIRKMNDRLEGRSLRSNTDAKVRR